MNISIIPCPPFSKFKTPLDEQPGCELITCEHCQQGMWISAKKRELRLKLPEYFIACYDCLTNFARKRKYPFHEEMPDMVNI